MANEKWEPTEEMLKAAHEAGHSHGYTGGFNYAAALIAVQPFIAAQERERIARTVKLYLGADSVIAEAVSSAIRAMGEKEPQG